MESQNTFVLPGLDGTDLLIDGFCQSAPSKHRVKVLTLGDDPLIGYRELCDYFSGVVESAGPCTLVGESFSGPLAVLLAHRHPNSVRHLVLVATFATTPMPRMGSVIPWSFVFRLPLPRYLARRFLVGSNEELVTQLKAAVQIQSPRTLARRIQAIAQIDVRSEIAELECPITYIRPTNDRLVSIRHMTTISRLNERVVVRQIDGPHLILQAQPRQAWQHIVDTAPASR